MLTASEFVKYTSPMLEIAQAVAEARGEEIKLCYQCGTCTAVCPWGNLKDFNPRKIIEQVRLGFEGYEEAAWTCVNCRLCQDKCPNEINIPQIFQAVRSILLMWNACPPELNVTLASLRDEGNPWQESRDKREEWTKDFNVPAYEAGSEYLLFSCCTNDYDPRNQKDIKAAVEILTQAGVKFGYMGNKEVCCGDMAYTAGENDAYNNLSSTNKDAFKELQVGNIITLSPHCLNAFKNRYEFEDSDRPESVHVVEIYAKLINDKVIQPEHEVARKVTYHDPCYLGRYNNIYDEPREIINAIPGIELVEMNNNRENSFCCGGGGGGAWLETVKGERLGDLRVLEAIETGAEAIITACPFCVQMLEASIKGLEVEDKISVITISELLLSSLKKEEQ